MSEIEYHIRKIERFIETWEVPAEELEEINKRKEVVENKIESLVNRGAVYGSQYGTELIGLNQRLAEIKESESAVLEYKENIAKFREKEKMVESLSKETEELKVKLNKQENEYNFIKNHPEIYEQFRNEIERLTNINRQITEEKDILVEENTKLKFQLENLN